MCVQYTGHTVMWTYHKCRGFLPHSKGDNTSSRCLMVALNYLQHDSSLCTRRLTWSWVRVCKFSITLMLFPLCRDTRSHVSLSNWLPTHTPIQWGCSLPPGFMHIHTRLRFFNGRWWRLSIFSILLLTRLRCVSCVSLATPLISVIWLSGIRVSRNTYFQTWMHTRVKLGI